MKITKKQVLKIVNIKSKTEIQKVLQEFLQKNWSKSDEEDIYFEPFDGEVIELGSEQDKKLLKSIGIDVGGWSRKPVDVKHWRYKLATKENSGLLEIKEMYVESADRFGVYGTFKEAERECKIHNLMIMMRNWAKFYNGDWKPDWRDKSQYKWAIELFDGDLKVNISHTCNVGIFQISLKTGGLCIKMLKVFRDELEEIKDWL